MNTLIVLAHPRHNSLNASLSQCLQSKLQLYGHHVVLNDLYRSGFNPITDEQISITADVIGAQEQIRQAEIVVLQFPLWWFTMPAMLKGWFDRVFTKGFAYDVGKIFATGLLKGKKVMISTTTQSNANVYSDSGHHGNIEKFLEPIHHTLRMAGFTILKPYVVYDAMNTSPDHTIQKTALTRITPHLLEQL